MPRWDGGGWPDLVVGLRLWQERYGAELVMADGTRRFMRVRRRPATADEAFELAMQQCAIAGDALTLCGVSLRDHARYLLHADRWLLWHKP